RDERERADRVARFPERVHLRNLLVERATGELDAQRIDADLADGRPGRLLRRRVVEPLRTRILVALVAEDAVVNFTEHFARTHARVGQLETVAASQTPLGPVHRFGMARSWLGLDEMPVIERFGKPEDHPLAVPRIVEA